MRNFFRYFCLSLAALLLGACAKDDPAPPPTVGRTMLVYMAGDNNLASDAERNLSSITAAMAGSADNARAVVYIDTPGENPRLVEATPSGQKELYRWPSARNSADAATLAEVIALTRSLAPATRYGLILWSHGMGWLPSSASDYLTRSAMRAVDPWPATKWFGQDTGASPTGYIETSALASAIPSGMFDYLLFDACFMGSVEVLYALREKADYIVSSPTEVITDGFPYGVITRLLLQESPDLQAVCRSYYDYYAGHPTASYRSATVSLVRTSELEPLAAATAGLYGAALGSDPAVFMAMDLTRLQRLDRYRRHFIFDLGSVADELQRQGAVTPAAVTAWRDQLARTVLFEAHTARFFDIGLTRCCGLSGYVPVAAYADINDDYQTLGWWRCFASPALHTTTER